MLDLNGILDIDLAAAVNQYTTLRLKDKTKYDTPEALCLYEQRILPNDKILELCEQSVGIPLDMPVKSFVPRDIIDHFKGTNVIPISFSPVQHIVTCVALPELGTDFTPMREYTVRVHYTTIYFFFEQMIRVYGRSDELLPVPAKDLIDAVVDEAIKLDAADITISSNETNASVYYNIRKRKVYSQRILSASDIEDVIKLLCIESPMDYTTNKPKYVGVELNADYRGRVVINKKFHGYEITIRVLPNAAFDKTLEQCNLTKEIANDCIRKYMMNRENGLRLIVGATMSGKNTTALAMLQELSKGGHLKVVSVEMPVEQELLGIEQINCNDEEEFRDNSYSLLRQNPDYVYITEISDATAIAALQEANTGKSVLSTLHANSCSDVISRLKDITHYSNDRILQCLHSILYQELVRDEEADKIYPKNRFVYLSQERKNQLYGLEDGEVIKKIQQWEGGDIW